MDANVKATPRYILNGIADGSGRDVTAVEEKLPGHLPLLFIMAQRGPDTVEYVDESSPVRIYGNKTFVEGSEYFTHQTNLLKRFLKHGNSVMVQRIIPPNAKKAMIRLSVELIPTELNDYEYSPDGNIVYGLDENGQSVPKITGTYIGTRVIWHASLNPEGLIPESEQVFRRGLIHTDFRNGNTQAVDSTPLTTIEGATSTIYPIMDIEFRDFGKYGNKVGLYIADITSEGVESLDLMSSVNDFLYRLRVVELDESNIPVIQRSKDADTYLTVSISDDTFDPVTNYNYAIGSVLNDKFETLKNVYIYQTNLKQVTDSLLNGYTQGDVVVEGELSNSHNPNDYLLVNGKLNIFHGIDSQSKPYKSFSVIDSYKFLGVDLARDYLLGEGGEDGLVVKHTGEHDLLANLQIFDTEVRSYLTNWAASNSLLQDPAKNPFTTLWDSGFALETKKSFAVPMAKRSDIWAVISTFMVADYVGPATDVVEPIRSWMTLLSLVADDGAVSTDPDVTYIAADKIQMGITGVTNGYIINGITAKDAGDNWNTIPFNAMIRPVDAEALRQLALTSPESVVIRDRNNNPLYTASQVVAMESSEEGFYKFPFVITRDNPVGTLTYILDWDGALNNNYMTNTWVLNWNITIQEPDPIASPITYGGISDNADIGYLQPVHYIETIERLSEQEINLHITNDAAAGWYWRYINLNAIISAEFIEAITRQAANGLEGAIVTVDINGTKTNYLAGEVITLNSDEDSNLLVPIVLNRNDNQGIINILADYDGNDGRRFYQTPLKINYEIDAVNPVQQISNIVFSGLDRNHEIVPDGAYVDPQYVTITERTAPNGVNASYQLTNSAEAGWYWNKVRMYATINAVDVAAMNAAYEAGYSGVVLTVKQDGVLIHTRTAAQIAVLGKDADGNVIVPLEINRAQPVGQFVFDMDWDAGHLDYLPGKVVINYELIATNPVPLTSWVTYQGLLTTGIDLEAVPEPVSPGDWYKPLTIGELTSANANQTLSLTGNDYSTRITNTVDAGWYWTTVPVYFTIAKDAVDLVRVAVAKGHDGSVINLTTPWRNYDFSSQEILGAVQADGTSWLSVSIPRTYSAGRMTAVVDWDLSIYPEATTTTINIDYVLNIVEPPTILSTVAWGGVDKTRPSIADATYLRSDAYHEDIIITPSAYNISITNDAIAGWYWSDIHTNILISEVDVNAMLNAAYNGFTIGRLTINHNDEIVRVSLDEIQELERDVNNNYLYPITLNRNTPIGTITALVDWDGNHHEYLDNETTFNYNITAVNPDPLQSTVTYRGVRTLAEMRTLPVSESGVISNNYLTEVYDVTAGVYNTNITTSPEAGWYWNSIKTYFSIAPEALAFLEVAIAKGHVGNVLTVSGDSTEVSYSTTDILALEHDVDGSVLIPHYIPREHAVGTITVSVDWDTDAYPEATPSVVTVNYELDIVNPTQVASEMRYYGVNNLLEYVSNGEYLLPQFSTETVTTAVNSYRTVIESTEQAGWYWNKVNVAALITAEDVAVIAAAYDSGYRGTVLTAHQNGTLIHTLDAQQILLLDRNSEGGALVPFTIHSNASEGEISAVIDWDVNHQNYTQSNWRLSYSLIVNRPNVITPVWTVTEDDNIIMDDALVEGTYTTTITGLNTVIDVASVYSEESSRVALKYTLNREAADYILDLAVIDPTLVVFNNVSRDLQYTASELAVIIEDKGELAFGFIASPDDEVKSFTLLLDLDGSQNSVYDLLTSEITYSFTNNLLDNSKLGFTYVDSAAATNFVSGWQDEQVINIALGEAPTAQNTYQVELSISADEYNAFLRARALGMPDNTIVLSMLTTANNAITTCTAAQLEAIAYTDDAGHAYILQTFNVLHGSVVFTQHWTRGYNGYGQGTTELNLNVIVLVKQELGVTNYIYDEVYGETIIPVVEYDVSVSPGETVATENVVIQLDDNYPIDRQLVRLAITLPVDVSARIDELAITSGDVAIFFDNVTGQAYTALDFANFSKVDDGYVYPTYVDIGSGNGILTYRMNLNAADEDLYVDYTYTVNYAVVVGNVIEPTLVPEVIADGINYDSATVTGSGLSYTVSMSTGDPDVPAFDMNLVIPKSYHDLISEAVAHNSQDIILRGENLVLTGEQYLELGTNENGDRVIPHYTVTPDLLNIDSDDPTKLNQSFEIFVSYTPNYSGVAPRSVVYNLEIEILLIDITCEDSTPTAFVELDSAAQDTVYDVQIDGVMHRGLTYDQLNTLLNSNGVKMIPYIDSGLRAVTDLRAEIIHE